MAHKKPTQLPKTGSGSTGWWGEQLEASKKARDDLKEDRRDLLARYRAVVSAASDDAVRVNIEFEKTETKRHQLFFQVPRLALDPHPRTLRVAEEARRDFEQRQQQAEESQIPTQGDAPPDLDRAVKVFREVLQRHAGPRGMNAKKLIDTRKY